MKAIEQTTTFLVVAIFSFRFKFGHFWSIILCLQTHLRRSCIEFYSDEGAKSQAWSNSHSDQKNTSNPQSTMRVHPMAPVFEGYESVDELQRDQQVM